MEAITSWSTSARGARSEWGVRGGTALCTEVAKLQVQRHERGQLLPRRLVDGDVSTLVDGHAARVESPDWMME
jgi:hypothetical protein